MLDKIENFIESIKKLKSKIQQTTFETTEE
jgi:hypothetical protein